MGLGGTQECQGEREGEGGMPQIPARGKKGAREE